MSVRYGSLDVVMVWQPQPGPQKALVDCNAPEVFFGGARGGGKTDGVLGKWALKERRYGKAFNAVGFRRTSVSFEDAIERAKQIFLPLGARFTDKPARFRMPNGGRVSFAYLENDDDALEYQGRNVTDAWVEETGQYQSSSPIDKLFGVLRSSSGVPVQLVLTANPGGAGQHWIRDRYKLYPFPRGPKLYKRLLPNGQSHSVAVIPSRITDNRILIDSDPGYIGRLHLVGSQQLVQAWLEGDWSAVEGAFFPEWSNEKHVVAQFEIPSHWYRFRSGDWGSARPFSIGWWAVPSDDFRTDDGRILPRGALLRYREWYGSSGPNVGLKLPAEQVAEGIKARERDDPKGIQGVLDPAAFSSDGGPSIAERMSTAGVYFRPADNARVARNGAMGGWDQVRSRLIGDGARPMLYVFSTCRDLIRTLPALQHDRDRPEDVDTEQEDHAPDECRYACMSRPYVREAPKDSRPKNDYRSVSGYGGADSALTI
ncbi:MAG: terminase [Bradyrhizobium sp.]|nr:terminase [Bradyrhizobium sp.]